MRKTDFIQHVIIRSLPHLDKVEAGVTYAESLWDNLCNLGYGATKQGKQAEPRDQINHYQKLKSFQKSSFDQFWKAFNYKHDRNNAAMRWAQLGELSESEYKTIIEAARKEASRNLPFGQSRKMAQGWLTEMRYQDYQANNNETNSNNQSQQRYSLLKADLVGVKRLYSYKQTLELAEQINKIEQQLKELDYEV